MQMCYALRPGINEFKICVYLRNHLFFLCLGVASRAASVSSAAALAASHRAMLCLVLSLASRALAITESAAATSCWPAGPSHPHQPACIASHMSTADLTTVWGDFRCGMCHAAQMSFGEGKLATTEKSKALELSVGK